MKYQGNLLKRINYILDVVVGNQQITGYLGKEKILALAEVDTDVSTTVIHEYGHHVMDSIFRPKNLIMPNTGRPHGFCFEDPQDEALAWSEGYANAFSLIMQNELDMIDFIKMPVGTYHMVPWVSGKERYLDRTNIEYYYCEQIDPNLGPRNSRVKNLLKDEGRILAMMYDLYDARGDSVKDPEVGEIIKQSKDKITPKEDFFGNANFKDANDEKTKISAKILLVDNLKKMTTIELPNYLRKLLYDKEYPEEQRKLACNIMKYNYWDEDEC